jgi:hypothetical protein
MSYILRRKTERKRIYKALVTCLFLLVTSCSFGQSKQLMYNIYAKAAVYPDLTIPFTKDYTTQSGVGVDVVIGHRFAYFFTFATGFTYHYQETKLKDPNSSLETVINYPVGYNGGLKKRKYKYNSVGVPFELKFFLPIGFSKSDGATDLLIGYTGSLLFNGGDQLKDWFADGTTETHSLKDQRVKSFHRFMIGASVNAGDLGDLDITFNLGFMAGRGSKQSNYFSLGVGAAYRIYWLD